MGWWALPSFDWVRLGFGLSSGQRGPAGLAGLDLGWLGLEPRGCGVDCFGVMRRDLT